MFQQLRDHSLTKLISGVILSWILVYGLQLPSPEERFISPLSSTKFAAQNSQVDVRAHFSFAPGWTLNNLSLVKFDNVQTVSYFDVPILDDGSLYKEGDGYILFKEKASEMLEKAHQHGTKVTLTVTQTDPTAIKSFLRNPTAQKAAIVEITDEVIDSGVDGVTIDVEYKGVNADAYRGAFSTFVSDLREYLRKKNPNARVNVAISGSALSNSFYDIDTLTNTADQIFIMAYDFAVPEVKGSKAVSPAYGYGSQDYWNTVSAYLGRFLTHIPAEKLVLETAWYGNGDDYPLYKPTNAKFVSKDTAPGVKNDMRGLTSKTLELMANSVPANAREAAKKNLPIIAAALKEENILNANVLAYAFATIEHETAGTFEPIEEIQGRKSARRLGYEGGTNYFGRGFIQLTHLRNYKMVGERIGLGEELAKNPDLALRPDISARILAAYFKDNGVATLAANGDFVDARLPINPDHQGWWIANLAFKYLNALS